MDEIEPTFPDSTSYRVIIKERPQRTTFDTSYPVFLQGRISEDEFHDCIERINDQSNLCGINTRTITNIFRIGFLMSVFVIVCCGLDLVSIILGGPTVLSVCSVFYFLTIKVSAVSVIWRVALVFVVVWNIIFLLIMILCFPKVSELCLSLIS